MLTGSGDQLKSLSSRCSTRHDFLQIWLGLEANGLFPSSIELSMWVFLSAARDFQEQYCTNIQDGDFCNWSTSSHYVTLLLLVPYHKPQTQQRTAVLQER